MIATRGPLVALPQELPVRILDGSPDAILICDRAGIVRYWNAAAERVFGFNATEALGASMNFIIPERLRDRHWAGWQAAMYRFMFNMVYDGFAWEVIEQDREAIEALPPWPAPEHLYQHDTGITRLRRHLRSEAEKQVGGGRT